MPEHVCVRCWFRHPNHHLTVLCKGEFELFFSCFNILMRSEEAKCFLEQDKRWPECYFPSLKYLWLQCGTALLAAVECIIFLCIWFHSFTILPQLYKHLEKEPVYYGTVLEVWIQIIGFCSGLIQTISWMSLIDRWIELLSFTKMAQS